MKRSMITLMAFLVLTTGHFSLAKEPAQATTQKKAPVPINKKENVVEVKTEPAAVEVVFVLDTTGSMSELIQAAKEKIWAIANTLATAKPTPTIKIGLVGYRDRGKDDYITKVTKLSDDLDAIFKDLMAYKADGGGDGPESVNQALHEAVTKIKWSKDNKTFRVIFLVGDAPPHMDYENDIRYPKVCQMAAKAEIVINTIQCGNNKNATTPWSKIAQLAEGSYFKVEQSGGAILASTPFDEDLSKLSIELGKTQVYYGSKQKRKANKKKESETEKALDRASSSIKAQRAEYQSKASAFGGGGGRAFSRSVDLIQDIEDEKVKLADVKTDELPVKLQKLSKKELKVYLKKQTAQRKEILKKIKALGEKRQKHIKSEIAKNNKGKKGSFDQAIYDAIQKQAMKKGLKYTGGPEQ